MLIIKFTTAFHMFGDVVRVTVLKIFQPVIKEAKLELKYNIGGFNHAARK